MPMQDAVMSALTHALAYTHPLNTCVWKKPRAASTHMHTLDVHHISGGVVIETVYSHASSVYDSPYCRIFFIAL